jgi:hypothetical protein
MASTVSAAYLTVMQEFSDVASRLKEIYRRLAVSTDYKERRSLLIECNQLVYVATRLIREQTERVHRSLQSGD